MIANIIAGLRLLSAFPIAWLFWEEEWLWAITFFLIASLSDYFDGKIARRSRNQKAQRVGEILDPLADRILVGLSFLVLGLKILPSWLVFGYLAGELSLGLYMLYYFIKVKGDIRIRPNIYGKIRMTAGVMTLILLALAIIAKKELIILAYFFLFITILFFFLAAANYIFQARGDLRLRQVRAE
jgi:phosphatidylglycerophosphate synthase